MDYSQSNDKFSDPSRELPPENATLGKEAP